MSAPTGARKLVPQLFVSYTSTDPASSVPDPAAQAVCVTAIALVAAILSRPSKSMAKRLLVLTSLLRMITVPASMRSLGTPGGTPLAGLPSPQICVPPGLPPL
jgi:hypothetical protein